MRRHVGEPVQIGVLFTIDALINLGGGVGIILVKHFPVGIQGLIRFMNIEIIDEGEERLAQVLIDPAE